LGTPRYMAPEQVLGASDVDHRADLWALGVIAYRMATGRLPFDAGGVSAQVMAVLTTNPPRASALNPSLPPEVDGFFSRALAKSPAARFQSARELALGLCEIADVSRSFVMPLTSMPALVAAASRPTAADSAASSAPSREPALAPTVEPTLETASTRQLRREQDDRASASTRTAMAETTTRALRGRVAPADAGRGRATAPARRLWGGLLVAAIALVALVLFGTNSGPFAKGGAESLEDAPTGEAPSQSPVVPRRPADSEVRALGVEDRDGGPPPSPSGAGTALPDPATSASSASGLPPVAGAVKPPSRPAQPRTTASKRGEELFVTPF
jgi:serine/threonine-protein kinase